MYTERRTITGTRECDMTLHNPTCWPQSASTGTHITTTDSGSVFGCLACPCACLVLPRVHGPSPRHEQRRALRAIHTQRLLRVRLLELHFEEAQVQVAVRELPGDEHLGSSRDLRMGWKQQPSLMALGSQRVFLSVVVMEGTAGDCSRSSSHSKLRSLNTDLRRAVANSEVATHC